MSVPARYSAMSVRERFHAVMNFEPVDRLPMIEWASWWGQTLQRWHGEGLDAGLDRYALYRHFGLDLYLQDWINPFDRSFPSPSAHGMGVIRGADDYERLRPSLYQPRIDAPRLRDWARRQESGQAVIWITLPGFFWWPRKLLGIENHFLSFYDQPELLGRINRDLTGWMNATIGLVRSICRPDFMTFAEDLSYNHGPMLSEALFDEFLLPGYQAVVPGLRSGGTRVFIDSDGRIGPALPWLERAGVEGALPLERQAGVDASELRRRHPRLLMIGHYDKMVMNRGETAIRAEFERLLPIARGGGFIVSVDHQTPPGVSLAEYRVFLDAFGEFVAAAAG